MVSRPSILLFGLIAALAATSPVSAGVITPAAEGTIDFQSIAIFAIRLLLLSGFLFATVASFKVPGTGVPETVALVLLAALIVPAAISGTAQWYEVVAILAGIALIAVEIFILPGLGATGVVGALLLLGGLTMVFVPDPRGEAAPSLAHFRSAGLLLIGGLIGGTLAVTWLGRYLPNMPGANRLVLRETNAILESAGPQLAVGDVGTALTDLRPGGVLRISLAGDDQPHRDISVVSDRGFIAAGQRLIVADIEGSKVVVRAEPSQTA